MDKEIWKEISKSKCLELRLIIQEKGITSEYISLKTGLSSNTIDRVVNGNFDPLLSVYLAIKKAVDE